MSQQAKGFERKKALAVVMSLVMLGISIGYMLFAVAFFQNLAQLDSQQFYLEVPMMVFPGLIASPIFLMSIYIFLRRHFGHLPERHFTLWIKTSLILLALAVLARIAVGFWIPSYIAAAGFTACSELENPSPYSAQVWVRHAEYCHPLSYLVRIETLDWFDAQQAAGSEPAVTEVTAQIEQLIAEHKRRYRN